MAAALEPTTRVNERKKDKMKQPLGTLLTMSTKMKVILIEFL